MSVAPKAPSPDAIRAGFIFPALDTIVGKPTYKTLALAHTQCIRNTTTTASDSAEAAMAMPASSNFPTYTCFEQQTTSTVQPTQKMHPSIHQAPTQTNAKPRSKPGKHAPASTSHANKSRPFF
jgi:hypothetical protein